MSEYVIGVDLGGTRIRVALLDSALNVLERHETSTLAEEGPDAVIGRIIDLTRIVLDKNPNVRGLGLSSPGPLNPLTGIVLAPPNLPGWHSVPLVQKLETALNVPVFIGNDANVAVLAEATRGAAKGCKNAIYLTLSTGIGGGVLVDNRLLLGQEGFAAEIGQMLLVVNGKATTLEKEAAGLALGRQARAALQQGRESVLLELTGGDIERVDAALVGKALLQNDALAEEIVARAGWMIGVGIASLLHLFNPEVIVIGGGVSNMGDPLFEPMHQSIKDNVIDDGYLQHLRIEKTALGDNVSIIGAAALVLTEGGLIMPLE